MQAFMPAPGVRVVWRNRWQASAILCVVAASCGKDVGPTGPTAANIVLNVESVTINQLDSLQLIPSFVDSKGTLIASVPTTFTSSDPTIISVSNIGFVKSLGPAGSATITVRGANLSKTVPVTVQSVATRVVVTPNPGLLQQKGTLQLTARLLDRVDAAIPNAVFTFLSSAPALASVSETGLVTSVGPAGAVSITVRSDAFAATAQIAIAQVPTRIDIQAPSPLRIGVNRSLRLPVRVLDAVDIEVPGQTFRFTSLNPSIITVAADGTITSVGPLGSAAVRIEALGTSLSVTHQVQIVIAASPAGTSVDTITVDGGYAASLTSGKAYVVGPFGSPLAAVNLQSRAVTNVTGGIGGYGIAVSRDDRRLYVTTGGGRRLREIDLATGSFTDIALSFDSYGLALSPDGRFAYVGTDAGRLLIVDLNSRTATGQVPATTGGLHVTIDAAGRFAYISWGGVVEELDLTSRQSVRTFNVPASHATALSADGRTLYVGTEAGAVYRVDLNAGTSAPFLSTPNCGSWGLGITPDDRFLYLACSGQGQIAVVDINARQIVRSHTGFAEPRRVAVSADGSIVVVAAANVLAVFR